jgi:hypothetical protein
MSLHQWMALAVGLLLLAFLYFTFMQGMKVKPRAGNPFGGLPPGGAAGAGS